MPKQWRELQIGLFPIKGHEPVNAVLTSPDLRPFLLRKDSHGRPLAAYTDRPGWTIYICASMPASEFTDTLVHELFHAAMWASGDRTGEFWTYEEEAIKRLTPYLLPALESMGWRAPPMPDGWESLQAHARYIRRRERAAKG